MAKNEAKERDADLRKTKATGLFGKDQAQGSMQNARPGVLRRPDGLEHATLRQYAQPRLDLAWGGFVRVGCARCFAAASKAAFAL